MPLNMHHRLSDGIEIGCLLTGAAEGRRPAILLLSEIFGVNEAMAQAAEALASAGYLVLAPDLYGRIAPGTALLYSAEERELALALWAGLDPAQSLHDLGQLIGFVRQMEGCDGRVAAVGFCLGGQLALLAALDKMVDAAVAFYPVKVMEYAARLPWLERPVQVHVGDCDQHLPRPLMGALEAGLAGVRNSEFRVYEGADHGFYNAVRSFGFHPRHAATAHSAMIGFLEAHLPGAPSQD